MRDNKFETQKGIKLWHFAVPSSFVQRKFIVQKPRIISFCFFIDAFRDFIFTCSTSDSSSNHAVPLQEEIRKFYRLELICKGFPVALKAP
jgi:hypothetical protein